MPKWEHSKCIGIMSGKTLSQNTDLVSSWRSIRRGWQKTATGSVDVLVDVLLGVDDDTGVTRLRGVLGVGGSREGAAGC